MAASTSKTLTRFRTGVLGDGWGGGVLCVLPFPKRYWAPSSSFCTSTAAISSSPQAQEQGKQGGSRWSKLFLFLPGAVTFGLGTWQILRRHDKIKMLEYRQKRLEMEPIKFNNISPSSEQLDALEFRRVACRGVFDEKRSIFVGPRSKSISGVTENGYYIITPLMPIANDPESVQSPILVNRGWVPRIWKENFWEVLQDEQPLEEMAPSAHESQQSSRWSFWFKKSKIVKDQIPQVNQVEVIGVIRGSEKPSIFVPENEPKSCQWFYFDIPAIASACGLPANTIYVEDIKENVNSSCPYPIPKDDSTLICNSVMPQDHLNYILTWYSLSAAVTFMAFKRLKQKKSYR